MDNAAPATIAALSFDQARWLRYAAHEYRALQAHEEYVPQEMPNRTRDALVRRGLIEKHTIVGMGGGMTYYTISPDGLALVSA